MTDFATTTDNAIQASTMHAKGGLHLRLREVGNAKFRAQPPKEQKPQITLESTNATLVSASLGGLFDGPRGTWNLTLQAKALGQATVTVKVASAEVAKLQVTVVARLELPAVTSEAGMLARLFLAESRLPGANGYSSHQARLSMEYMKLVLYNRLKFSKWFGAPGAKTLRDIVTAPKAIEGFSRYPTLGPGQAMLIESVLRLANDDNHPKQADYVHIVQTAIEVAQSRPIIDPSSIGLYGWRTSGSGSLGPNFVVYGTSLSGNQFYTLKEALK